jgi:dipeptidyl aminopeptidase/acylaminoacyl peptidase
VAGRRVRPYGTWASPITAEWIARGSVTLDEPRLAAGRVWWVEARPAEDGRAVVVCAALDGSRRADAIPEGFSARTRVHEYGGGAYTVDDGGAVWFSNDADGRVYRVDPGGVPSPVTPEPPAPRALRYADFDLGRGGTALYCVRESHTGGGEAVNEIVALDPAGASEPRVVATGADFYAAPRVSPDGRTLAYLSWNHPRMPWDGTELWRAPAAGGEPRLVAGSETVSVASPRWSPAGVLHWVSDESGWWNLYADGRALHRADAEFGWPAWVFADDPYAFLDDGRIVCAWTKDGFHHVGVLDPGAGALHELGADYVPHVPRLVSDGGPVAYVGASPTRLPAVVTLDPDTGTTTVIARSSEDEPDSRYVSVAEPIEYESGGGRRAHALFYRPRSAAFAAPEGEQPPLLVMTHGGPTGQTMPHLKLSIQYWTSRGFAVADVNYGGSTGYGRAYRELLRDNWGVVDLEDVTHAARHLAAIGEVDGARLAIEGGSAGGYTTLCALAFTDVFHAGASRYGVADIGPLFADTHKFESRYGDGLVPAEEMDERSPINAVDRITAPVIVFQGLEDEVVPPSQSERIVEALSRRGIAHEYRAYEGEQHGFRKAETIIDSLEAELRFFGRVFGFEPQP